jgi:hypothetical protein
MITQGRITTSTITSPTRIFTASTTGAVIGGAVIGQTSAITTIVLCNTGTPDLTDETVDLANVNVYLVKSGNSASTSNIIVSNLPVPAGETVFFSDERIILDSGDSVWVGADTANLITVTVSTLPV